LKNFIFFSIKIKKKAFLFIINKKKIHFKVKKFQCHGSNMLMPWHKIPLQIPLFGLLIIGVPWHKTGFSDLVQGTHIEGLG
jgi:hypothetical protein